MQRSASDSSNGSGNDDPISNIVSKQYSNGSIPSPQVKSSPSSSSSPIINSPNMIAQQHAPPSAESLLANLNPSFFETPPEEFDEKLEALSGFGNSVDTVALSEGLLKRIEAIDLARDVVSSSLGNEVRKSSSSLLAGMRQVQDLDLEVARTSLHAVAIRRRLAHAKRDLFQAQLRVSKLSTRRDRLQSIRGYMSTLVQVRKLKLLCDSTLSPLSSSIEVTLKTLQNLLDTFPQELDAVKSTIALLKDRIPEFVDRSLQMLQQSIKGPALDYAHFQDFLKCFHNLKKQPEEIFDAILQVWREMIVESDLTVSIGLRTGGGIGVAAADRSSFIVLENDTTERPFVRVFNTCSAFSQVLHYFSASTSDNTDTIPKDRLIAVKRECLATVTRVADDYLKSPLVRSQVLDDFALTIEDATKLTESLELWFGTDDLNSSQYFSKTKMESTIRLRARVYAQQYQAEGFQAMRGLLWRETWVDVASGTSTNSDHAGDFAVAIFRRLGLTPPTSNTPNAKRYVLTATMASGLPRQVQRTQDLMKKLPTSASGEAFLGLLRIIDLYLLAIVSVFVPKTRFFDSRKEMRSAAYLYMTAVQDSLAEWLITSSSPRNHQHDLSGLSIGEDEEVVRLCECEFLDDGAVSFEPAWIASASLEFLDLLVKGMEKPLSEPLPAVERVKLASKMFVELPPVIAQIRSLVKRSAVERLCLKVQFPDLTYVYEGGDVDHHHYSMDAIGQFANFHDTLLEMQVVFQRISSNPQLHTYAKSELWDESCALFLDQYIDAIAAMPSCSPIERGNMIVHLASFWEKLNQMSSSRNMSLSAASTAESGRMGNAAKARARVDDYIKAFYYDKPSDLWDWMRRKKEDFEPHQFSSVFETGLVGQSAGAISYVSTGNGTTRAIGGKKELRQEFDKVIAGIFG